MNAMQQALIQACENLDIPYEIVHKDNIDVRVKIGNNDFHYIHWFMPFNRADAQRILRDKDLQYTLLHEVIAIPQWKAYLNPIKKDEYPYAVGIYSSAEAINTNIVDELSLPVLIKPNTGLQGKNVRICHSANDVLKAVNHVFDVSQDGHSYIAIAQELVDVAREYRVLGYKGKNVLTYEKDTSNASFNGNISPLHWEGAKAVHIIDDEVLLRLESFIKPVFNEIDLIYGGFDIAEDVDGKLWLLEINRIPGVSIFVRDNGLGPIVTMHEEILKDLLISV